MASYFEKSPISPGERIRTERTRQHLTQAGLVARPALAHTSPADLSRIEKGVTKTSIRRAREFAAALEVTPGYLLERSPLIFMQVELDRTWFEQKQYSLDDFMSIAFSNSPGLVSIWRTRENPPHHLLSAWRADVAMIGRVVGHLGILNGIRNTSTHITIDEPTVVGADTTTPEALDRFVGGVDLLVHTTGAGMELVEPLIAQSGAQTDVWTLQRLHA